VNVYGASLGAAFPHRFLLGPKDGLFPWESGRQFSIIFLVEGLLDLAMLWQAGFRNTTYAFDTHLTSFQFHQLSAEPHRLVYIVFDEHDAGGASALSSAPAGRSGPARPSPPTKPLSPEDDQRLQEGLCAPTPCIRILSC
jgi:hypothetical protein